MTEIKPSTVNMNIFTWICSKTVSEWLEFYVPLDTQQVISETSLYRQSLAQVYWQLKTNRRKYTKNTKNWP